MPPRKRAGPLPVCGILSPTANHSHALNTRASNSRIFHRFASAHILSCAYVRLISLNFANLRHPWSKKTTAPQMAKNRLASLDGIMVKPGQTNPSAPCLPSIPFRRTRLQYPGLFFVKRVNPSQGTSHLVFGSWFFPGAWMLVLGASFRGSPELISKKPLLRIFI
ncbi:MAG: hypothetical protein JWQ04_1316 [Pedosphaera sp.]|nr:hypothetical protein [Pedosphaera sp.]